MMLNCLTQYPCNVASVTRILEQNFSADLLLQSLRDIYPQKAFSPQKKEYFVLNSIGLLLYLEKYELWPILIDFVQHSSALTSETLKILHQVVPIWITMLSKSGEFQGHFWILYQSNPRCPFRQEYLKGAILSYYAVNKNHTKHEKSSQIQIPLEYKEELIAQIHSNPNVVAQMAYTYQDTSYLSYLNDCVYFYKNQNVSYFQSPFIFYWFVLMNIQEGNWERVQECNKHWSDYEHFHRLEALMSAPKQLHPTLQGILETTLNEFNEFFDSNNAGIHGNVAHIC